MFQNLLAVGAGGFCGASCRYLITMLFQRFGITYFPFATLAANSLGGLLIGIIMTMTLTTEAIPPVLKLFLVTGLLGGLTTFSTFSYETIQLFTQGHSFLAITNIAANILLSMAGVLIGQWFIQVILS